MSGVSTSGLCDSYNVVDVPGPLPPDTSWMVESSDELQEDRGRRVVEALAAGGGPRSLHCRVRSSQRSSLRP